MRVKGLAAGYGRFLGEEGLDPRTIHYYLADLGIFLDVVCISLSSSVEKLKDVGPGSVVKYMSHNRPSQRTRSRRHSSLKRFYNYCISNNILHSNPAETVGAPGMPDNCPDFLMSVEYGKLIRAIPLNVRSSFSQFLNRRDRSMISWLYNDNLSPGDVVNTRYRDILPESNPHEFVSVKRKEGTIEIPLSGTSLREMRAYENAFRNEFGASLSDEPDKKYFRNRHGNGLSARRLRSRISGWGKKALGRDNVTPRTIHNGSIARLLHKGKAVHDIAELAKAGTAHTYKLKNYVLG